jgi:hypothetical protein
LTRPRLLLVGIGGARIAVLPPLQGKRLCQLVDQQVCADVQAGGAMLVDDSRAAVSSSSMYMCGSGWRRSGCGLRCAFRRGGRGWERPRTTALWTRATPKRAVFPSRDVVESVAVNGGRRRCDGVAACGIGPSIAGDAGRDHPVSTCFFSSFARHWRIRTSVLLTSPPLLLGASANIGIVIRGVVILPKHGLEVWKDRPVELP